MMLLDRRSLVTAEHVTVVSPTAISDMLPVLLLSAVAAIVIRPAVLSNPADAEALCSVRRPTEYVVEQGSTGFMGQKTELSAEEAQKRRVQARLGTAMRDGAIVLMATDVGSIDVIGTVDCVEFPAGKGRRALAAELPRRLLLRNLWVCEERRRQGIARELMCAVDSLADEMGVSFLSLEVLADNEPAIKLYEDLGFTDLEPPPFPLPAWMRGALFLGKGL